MNIKRLSKLYTTAAYIGMVLLINAAFSTLPIWHINSWSFASADIIAGIIYIVRDFAQRAIGQKVIFAMIAASIISYSMSAAAIATASVLAFATAETLDWLIYTFTKKPLSQRLLLSSVISTPVDSLIFLLCIGRLTWADMLTMTISKWLGVLVVWWLWRMRAQAGTKKLFARDNSASQA